MPTETLGQRIRRLRMERGWRFQVALAKAVGVNPSTLNQIEKDQRPPSRGTLLALAQVLDVPPSLISTGKTGKPDARHTSPPSPAPEVPRTPRTGTRAAQSTDDSQEAESPDIGLPIESTISTASAHALRALAGIILDALSRREKAEFRRQSPAARAGRPVGDGRD